MNNITFISTVHKEMERCNADELCAILEKVRPEVIFLEALEKTYSKYEENLFSSFGVYHQKLEIKAIQKYRLISLVEYVPVLDNGLPDSFHKKYDLVCENKKHQMMVDDYNSLASNQGFQFLNSEKSMILQGKMRKLESRILPDHRLQESFNQDINAYENSMMQNILLYCRENQFRKAAFLCGVAHRQSIIEKIESLNNKETIDIDWVIYGRL